jgi:hypothetical protein
MDQEELWSGKRVKNANIKGVFMAQHVRVLLSVKQTQNLCQP